MGECDSDEEIEDILQASTEDSGFDDAALRAAQAEIAMIKHSFSESRSIACYHFQLSFFSLISVVSIFHFRRPFVFLLLFGYPFRSRILVNFDRMEVHLWRRQIRNSL